MLGQLTGFLVARVIPLCPCPHTALLLRYLQLSTSCLPVVLHLAHFFFPRRKDWRTVSAFGSLLFCSYVYTHTHLCLYMCAHGSRRPMSGSSSVALHLNCDTVSLKLESLISLGWLPDKPRDRPFSFSLELGFQTQSAMPTLSIGAGSRLGSSC